MVCHSLCMQRAQLRMKLNPNSTAQNDGKISVSITSTENYIKWATCRAQMYDKKTQWLKW